MKNQYEQQCNATALEKLGVLKLKSIDSEFESHLYKWMEDGKPIKMDYSQTIPQCLDFLFENQEIQEINENLAEEIA
jgi:hypothetical protein